MDEFPRTSQPSDARPSRTVRSLRRPIRLGLLLALLLGALTLYKAGRIGYYAWQLYRQMDGLRTWAQELRDGPDPLVSLVEQEGRLRDTVQALAGLEKELRFLAPALAGLEGLGPRGAWAAAAPKLLVVAAEMGQVGSQALTLVAPALQASDPDGWVPGILAELDGQEATFQAMAARVERATRALEALDPVSLPPSLQEPVTRAQEVLPLAARLLPLGPSLPRLMGMEGPTTYLLLVQNNHELRGTGGFISAVGRVVVERGRLVDLAIVDSYAVDNLQVPHPPAPPPLQRYMQATILALRDANWSPDLPTSARTVQALYRQDQGIQVDGVITVDLRAVELLLDGIGGVRLPGVEGPVTGENVVAILTELWGDPRQAQEQGRTFQEWWRQRKAFIPALAQALLAKLRGREVDPWPLYRAVRQALEERAIQIWVEEPATQAVLADLGWDGGLRPQAGADYLALVDSNVGFNKVDGVMERRLAYRVEWPDDDPDGRALAQATITYRHTLPVPGHTCLHTARYGGEYREMMRRCYFDYVRLYVPRGSELLSVQGVEPDSVASYPGEKRTQVLAGFFVLEPGQTHTVIFTYRLPPSIRADSYRLVIQRQAGSGPLPVAWSLEEELQRQTVLSGNLLVWSPPP